MSISSLPKIGRPFLLGAALMACALLFWASCGGQQFQAGPLGAVEVPEGEDIHIRSLSALTGVSSLGTPNLRGVALAVADYGTIKGRQVTMGAGIDSACTREGGRAAAETAIGDPRVVGVVGTSCSIAATGALPVISEAGLVMVAPSTTAPSLTSDLKGNAGADNRPGYYRASTNDLHQASAAARFAYEELGLRTIASIHDGGPYTSGLAGAFNDAFLEVGGAATIHPINRGDSDMAPLLTRIAENSPDGLFLPLFPAEGVRIMESVGQVDGLEDVTLMGGAALLVSEVLSLHQSRGIYFMGPEADFGSNTNEATGKNNDDLVASYVDQYSEQPTSAYLAHAYDATTILLRAIEETAVAEGDTLYIDRAMLRENLSDTSSFGGIIGSITCDEFGDCGTGRIVVYHHTDSSITEVAELPVVYRFVP